MCTSKQFPCKAWPVQLVFLLLLWGYVGYSFSSWLYLIFHSSHDGSKLIIPNLPQQHMSKLSSYFYLLSKVSKYSDTDAKNWPQKRTAYIVNCGWKLQINLKFTMTKLHLNYSTSRVAKHYLDSRTLCRETKNHSHRKANHPLWQTNQNVDMHDQPDVTNMGLPRILHAYRRTL